MFIDSFNIINKEKYDKLEEFIICPICNGIISEPYKCINCQNNFCKICIGKWLENNNNCPFRCVECLLEPNKLFENILSEILIFKCNKGCSEKIPYSKLFEHYKNECINRKKIDYKERFELLVVELENKKVEIEDMLDEKEEVKAKIEEDKEEIQILKQKIKNINQKIYEYKKVKKININSIIQKNQIEEYIEKNKNKIEELKQEIKNIKNDEKEMNNRLRILKKKKPKKYVEELYDDFE